MEAILNWLSEPILQTDWTDWRGFWLQEVLADRFLVFWFIPLVPVLLMFSRRTLRAGIVITGLLWCGYIFGVIYTLLWLGMCLVFWRLAEVYAVESRRTDIKQCGPHAGAALLIVGWWLALQGIQHIKLPDGFNEWLGIHLPGAYPLGARVSSWEPWWVSYRTEAADGRPLPQLLGVMLANLHNVGIAYFIVRMLHYYSEVARGGILRDRRSFGNFLAYTCYAPAWMQGPIERYNVFQDEMDTCHDRRTWRNVPAALGRIGMGVGKCLIALLYIHPVLVEQMGWERDKRYYEQPELIESTLLLYSGVFLQIFALFLHFSGYCDVSAGIARLLGYRQIENFNWPWLATSLRDFWRRWHISLSSLLRDYVYIPLGGNRTRATFNLCVTFILCGLWHVPVPQMFTWGLVMGLMLAVNQGWAAWMKRLEVVGASAVVGSPGEVRFAAMRRGIQRLRPLPQVLSWALTMHAFVFSLLIFFGGIGGVRVLAELVRRGWKWLAG